MQHFVIGKIDEDLLIDFFDPNFTMIEAKSMEELFVIAGVFKSKGDARKNGFSGDIPDGIHLLGTKKTKFWIWKNGN